MSGQSAASQLTKIQSQLECPVCLKIPRDLPVPSCPSGHIVCRPCKTRVTDCPTCRKPMPDNMTNSVVGALIEEVQHNCKFNDEGCEVKMMLKDLVIHEKLCPDRSINCPYPGCAQLVKLKSFDTHALEGFRHSLVVSGSLDLWFILGDNLLCHDWSSSIKVFDEFFHVNLAYHKPSKCFVFRIWLAKSQDVASQYKATLVIKGDNNSLCFDGINVSSVENVPSINKCLKETENISLCLQMNLAKKLSVKKEVEGIGIVERLKVAVLFKKNGKW